MPEPAGTVGARLPFVEDVRVVLVVGADPAPALADAYPEARIHAVGGADELSGLLDTGVARVDVLRLVGGAGAEAALARLLPLVPTVKVAYVRSDTRGTRRAIDGALAGTHDVYTGRVLLDDADCTYLRRDLARLPSAVEHLRDALRAATQEDG